MDDKALTQAALDVLAERERQVNVESWTPEHDDEHRIGDLALAAACYANAAARGVVIGRWKQCPSDWPFDFDAWKPKDRRNNLIRAGALILAEIERLDRVARHGEQEGTKE